MLEWGPTFVRSSQVWPRECHAFSASSQGGRDALQLHIWLVCTLRGSERRAHGGGAVPPAACAGPRGRGNACVRCWTPNEEIPAGSFHRPFVDATSAVDAAQMYTRDAKRASLCVGSLNANVLIRIHNAFVSADAA